LDSSDDIVIDELYDYLVKFIEKNKQRYSIERTGAYIFSKNFSWEIFIKNYLKAYEIARAKKD
jgi:glycosyltransferase involved in cell wall biosynthesis